MGRKAVFSKHAIMAVVSKVNKGKSPYKLGMDYGIDPNTIKSWCKAAKVSWREDER